MIRKQDEARGPPIGVITLLDPDTHSNNNVTPHQAILSVYKSYRDFSTSTRRQSSTTTTTTTTTIMDELVPSTSLCTHSIPSYMSMPDFLNFVAPVDSFVSHYRVLCDSTSESYLVLMTFRDEKMKQDYYKQYNKRKFSSMEDQVCQIVSIKTIKRMVSVSDDSIRFFSLDSFSGGLQNNCPVCLDALDESLTGLLTTLCQHTFHVHCLSQWGDGSCPVCRYSQKPNIISPLPPPPPSSSSSQQEKQQLQSFNNTNASSRYFQQDDFINICQDCGWTEHLWICLVCGQISCGQEHESHALNHYHSTHHVYALDIDSQRVWDYAGDNYVHRLIQNVVDGKLVELPQPLQQHDTSVSDMVQGKLNAMALEYSYLLTSQLDSQRMYYEDRINTTLETLAQISDGCKQVTRELDIIYDDDVDEWANQVNDTRKHNTRLIHKVTQWKEKTKMMERNYLEEKELTRSISQNNALVKDDIEKVQHQLDIMAAKSAEWMKCLEQDDTGPSSTS